MLIIDTRSPHEYEASHVQGAVNLPPEMFTGGVLPAALVATPKDGAIVVYCRSGARSNVVKAILEQHGYSNVTNGINQGYVEKLLHT